MILEYIDNKLLLVDPDLYGPDIFCIHTENVHDTLSMMSRNCTIVQMKDTPGVKYLFKPRLITCVILVKYWLGIKSWSLTPYALYKFILKHNLGELYGTR